MRRFAAADLSDPGTTLDSLSSPRFGLIEPIRDVFPIVHTLYVLLREG